MLFSLFSLLPKKVIVARIWVQTKGLITLYLHKKSLLLNKWKEYISCFIWGKHSSYFISIFRGQEDCQDLLEKRVEEVLLAARYWSSLALAIPFTSSFTLLLQLPLASLSNLLKKTSHCRPKAKFLGSLYLCNLGRGN